MILFLLLIVLSFFLPLKVVVVLVIDYIKVKFADDVPISQEVEMIYSAGLLQSKYRKDRTIKFPITIAYNLTGWKIIKT